MPSWLTRILAGFALPVSVMCIRDHHVVWGGVFAGLFVGLICNAIDRRRA